MMKKLLMIPILAMLFAACTPSSSPSPTSADTAEATDAPATEMPPTAEPAGADNVASKIDVLDEPPGGSRLFDSYGSVSLHAQSHGESFLALLMRELLQG